MKKFIALTLVTLGITVPARAQWIVYDPANTVQSVINTAQEVAQSSFRRDDHHPRGRHFLTQIIQMVAGQSFPVLQR